VNLRVSHSVFPGSNARRCPASRGCYWERRTWTSSCASSIIFASPMPAQSQVPPQFYRSGSDLIGFPGQLLAQGPHLSADSWTSPLYSASNRVNCEKHGTVVLSNPEWVGRFLLFPGAAEGTRVSRRAIPAGETRPGGEGQLAPFHLLAYLRAVSSAGGDHA
jgi:hypothetical protein